MWSVQPIALTPNEASLRDIDMSLFASVFSAVVLILFFRVSFGFRNHPHTVTQQLRNIAQRRAFTCPLGRGLCRSHHPARNSATQSLLEAPQHSFSELLCIQFPTPVRDDSTHRSTRNASHENHPSTNDCFQPACTSSTLGGVRCAASTRPHHQTSSLNATLLW